MMRSMFGRLPVMWKIALAPGFALVCLCLLAGVVLHGQARTRDSIVALEQSRFPAYARAVEIEAAIDALNGMVNQSIAWQGAGAKQSSIAKLDQRIAEQFAATAPLLQGDDFASLAPLYDTFRKGCSDTLDMKSVDLGAAAGYITTVESDYRAMKQALRQIVDRKRDATLADFHDVLGVLQTTSRVLLATLAAALGVCSAVTLVAARGIATRLREAAAAALRVARGDLTARTVAHGSDETGRMLAALGEVSEGLSAMVGTIRNGAQTIDTASQEIAQGHDDLAMRTERQAANLQQTAATLSELTASVRDNAASADCARQSVEQASRLAVDGDGRMQAVVDVMTRIQQQSSRIGDIVGTIDSLAFQTNILALNAAVEAARAGEQGRGFAVVASEVRALAGRSATAAREIRRLIETSSEQVGEGCERVDSARQQMQQVLQSIDRAEQTVRSIAAACATQAGGVEEVHRAVTSIDHATQQNAALVEQATASAASLRQQSARLVESIAAFRTA